MRLRSRSGGVRPESLALGVMTGSAVVSWTPPATTLSGARLTDLGGYEVFYGRNPSQIVHLVLVPDPSVTRVVVCGHGSGMWYFVVTAYTRSGAMSFPSKAASKTIL